MATLKFLLKVPQDRRTVAAAVLDKSKREFEKFNSLTSKINFYFALEFESVPEGFFVLITTPKPPKIEKLAHSLKKELKKYGFPDCDIREVSGYLEAEKTEEEEKLEAEAERRLKS